MNQHPYNDDDEPMARDLPAIFWILVALTILCFSMMFSGCQHAPKRAASPQYAGVITKAGDLSGSIGQARSDSKEVKRLQSASLTVLDQLDSKLVKLLQK
jgi:hypothetical protein